MEYVQINLPEECETLDSSICHCVGTALQDDRTYTLQCKDEWNYEEFQNEWMQAQHKIENGRLRGLAQMIVQFDDATKKAIFRIC